MAPLRYAAKFDTFFPWIAPGWRAQISPSGNLARPSCQGSKSRSNLINLTRVIAATELRFGVDDKCHDDKGPPAASVCIIKHECMPFMIMSVCSAPLRLHAR